MSRDENILQKTTDSASGYSTKRWYPFVNAPSATVCYVKLRSFICPSLSHCINSCSVLFDLLVDNAPPELRVAADFIVLQFNTVKSFNTITPLFRSLLFIQCHFYYFSFLISNLQSNALIYLIYYFRDNRRGVFTKWSLQTIRRLFHESGHDLNTVRRQHEADANYTRSVVLTCQTTLPSKIDIRMKRHESMINYRLYRK